MARNTFLHIAGSAGESPSLAAVLPVTRHHLLSVPAPRASGASGKAAGRHAGDAAVSGKGRLHFLYSDDARWLVCMGGVVLDDDGAAGRSPPRG
jgi:hypothetical protein